MRGQTTGKQIRPDAILRIAGEIYTAEVKAWAQHAPLGPIMEMIKRYPRGVLIADYINPTMAEKLKAANVQFIDTAGNAFIKTDFYHVEIKGNRRAEFEEGNIKPRKLRAFTAAGLKVTYVFIRRPELIAAPYRDIADLAGVALGTVQNVIADLAEAGYLLVYENDRRLTRWEEVLRTWVERYPATLRPKLHMGVYAADDPNWWQHFDLEPFGAMWGGEVAAAHYTGYLTPATATIYVQKGVHLRLIAAGRLRKIALPLGEPATVELLTPFWHLEEKDRNYVHPILTYADLLATDEARNMDTAKKLYETHIDKHLG